MGEVLVDSSDYSDIFWNTTDILNFARVLINDAQGSIQGQDLADVRPYTWPLLNFCYGRLQNWLQDNNVESSTYAEQIIQLPISSGSSDPNQTCRLGYDGFDDSNGFHYDTPTLPSEMLEPLNIWQRQTGQNAPFRLFPQRLGGLRASLYGNFLFSEWEFRQNSLYFSGGCYTPMDIRIRFIPSFPELVQPTGDQPAPTIYFGRAGEALAYMIAAEFLEIRSAANAPAMRAKAVAELDILANKSAKRENQAMVRRKGYGFGRRRRSIWL